MNNSFKSTTPKSLMQQAKDALRAGAKPEDLGPILGVSVSALQRIKEAMDNEVNTDKEKATP